MVRDRLLRDIFGAFEGAGQAGRADAFDEYRDLVMLANAWERGSLAVEVAEEAPGPLDDAEKGIEAEELHLGERL